MPPPGADPFAAIAEAGPSADPFSAIAEPDFRPTSTAHAAEGAPVVTAVPDAGLLDRAKAWLRAAPAGVNLGGAEVERALQPLMGKPLPMFDNPPDAMLSDEGRIAKAGGPTVPNQHVAAARAYLNRTTAAEPLATKGGEILAGVTGFAGGPVAGATVMGSNAMQDATEAGASPARAVASGMLSSASGALAPVAGRAVAPLGEALAKPIADAAGTVPAALARGAVEGAPQGLVLGAGNVASTAAYDPVAARGQLEQTPESIVEMALINALAHGGHATLGRLSGQRAAPGEASAHGPSDPFASIAEPVDPSAATQEIPVLTEDQITPPTWQPHGPINTEPIGAVRRSVNPTPADIAIENRLIDQGESRLEAIHRIRSTGEPVVGADRTMELDPLAHGGDTQDRVMTHDEGAPDAIMHRNVQSDFDPMSSNVDPQDVIRTQAMNHQGFPGGERQEYPTYATADLSPNEAIMRNVRRQQATDPRGFERQGIDALNRGMPPEDHITQVTQDHLQALRDLTAELKAARTKSPEPIPETSNAPLSQEVSHVQASARPQEGGALLDATQRREVDAGHSQPVKEAGRAPDQAPEQRRQRPAAERPPVSGIAPGERINERPDLALPSKDPAVRDMMKKDDATMGRPEERPRDVANQEAEKRLAGGGEHEERRLEAKMSEPSASLNEAEQAGVRKMIDRAYSAGDADRAVRLHRQLRAVRTEGARAMGAGVDMSEPPAVRAARTVQDLALRPSGRARMMEGIAKKHGKKLDTAKGDAQVKLDLQRIAVEARKAGIDPNTLQPLAKPATVGAKVVKKAQALVGARKAKVDADYAKLKDDIKRLWNTKNPSASSTGGALADALTQLAFNRAEAGVLKFSDFVLEAAKIIPGFKSDTDAQEQLRKAWESAREKRPDLGMDASERPLDVLVKDAKDRAQALADKWVEKHAEAKAMSPEDRVRYLEQKAAAKQVPEEIASAVKDINDQKRSLQDRIRSRDAAILYNHDRMLRIVQKVKGDAWDTYYEWARSAAHTSLKLPPKKLASDLAQLTYHFGAEAPLARLVNALIPGGKDARSFADLKPMWAGLLPGLRWGWRNALETWKTDTSALRDQVVQAQAERSIRTGDEFKSGNINEFHGGTRLKGAAGLIRWNIKSVQAFNDLAESTFARMAVAEHAMASATEKGLTGDALRDHLFNEMKDLSSPSWQKALDDAEGLTGTKQVTGKFNPVYWINRARFMDPYQSDSTAEYAANRVVKEAARWTFLFTTLPYNFAKMGLAISPVGGTARMVGSAAKAGVSAARGGPWDYSRADFNTHIAQQLIGYAALGLIAETAAGDDPKVTGYEEWNPKREGLRAPPAHSVYLFGKWRDYGGLGPVAHLIGTSADMLKAYHDTLHGKSAGSAAEDVIASMGRQFRDETVLRNLGDVHAATTSEEGAARILSSWATLAYPTMLKQIVKEYGDTKEDHRIKEDPFWRKVAQHVAQDTGASMAYSFPAVDIFGNDILKPSEAGTKAVDYPFRLANPFTGPGDRTGDDDLKRAILNYNETHPEEPVYPAEPSPKFKRPGAAKSDEMTREQFHEFVKLTGQKAADMLRAGGPLTDETLPKRVKEAFDRARDIARRQIVGTNVSAEP